MRSSNITWKSSGKGWDVDMNEKMVPKQIRLTQKQNMLLKRLAKERGVSESEVLRQVLEREMQRSRQAEAKPEK